jgi:pyridoxal phosphate enzyme (YggS family)
MFEDKIAKINERIARACAKAGRGISEVSIVAVTKNRPVEQINEVLGAGVAAIGENKVQEALSKFSDGDCHLGQSDGQVRASVSQRSVVSLHMIGHLQTNKVKDAVRIFDLIHSVDSLRLAAELDKQAAKINKVQDILIEVNTSAEAAKFGIKPTELAGLVSAVAGLKNIRLLGLMTIAAAVDDPEKSRPYFKKLRELRDSIYELRVTDYELRILSMGMTDDFEVAVEEGSTLVRIGRAIFED